MCIYIHIYIYTVCVIIIGSSRPIDGDQYNAGDKASRGFP